MNNVYPLLEKIFPCFNQVNYIFSPYTFRPLPHLEYPKLSICLIDTLIWEVVSIYHLLSKLKAILDKKKLWIFIVTIEDNFVGAMTITGKLYQINIGIQITYKIIIPIFVSFNAHFRWQGAHWYNYFKLGWSSWKLIVWGKFYMMWKLRVEKCNFSYSKSQFTNHNHLLVIWQKKK